MMNPIVEVGAGWCGGCAICAFPIDGAAAALFVMGALFVLAI